MFKKLTRQKLNIFLSKHRSSARVLDIGAGGSSYDTFFPNRISIDIDPKRGPDIVGDAHDLPFSDGEFEMILCTEVLEHLKDPRRAIEEMKRVLKEGGVAIVTTRFVYPIHDSPHDYWRFTKYGLEELFKEWEVIECVAETEVFSTVAVLLQRIAFQTTLRLNKLAKLNLFIFAYICDHLNFLVENEYGDIKKKTQEKNIMPSGYYMMCKKK